MSRSLLARILLLSKFKCTATIYKRQSFISLTLFNFASAPRQQTFAATEKEKLKKGAKSCEKVGVGGWGWGCSAGTKRGIHFTLAGKIQVIVTLNATFFQSRASRVPLACNHVLAVREPTEESGLMRADKV